MKIVIVGDGKVGNNLARQLSNEGHELIIVDNDPDVIDEANNTLDIVGVLGNGASYKVLNEAQVAKADLLIATMELDELNILSCLIAKKLGTKHTIARIRNPEYSEQLMFMREELGLSMHINPEYLTALELFRILRLPSALKVETFAKSKVEMVEIKLQDNCLLNNVLLKEIQSRINLKVLVCVVKRGDEIHIPDGNFVLKANDIINIVAAPYEIRHFLKTIGADEKPINDVIIIGGSKIAYYLSKMLLELGVNLKIIESNKERCYELSELLPKALIIHGDGADQELLLEEGVMTTDALVTLTDMDEQNILISMYGKSLKVKKVLTKINRLSLATLVKDKGLDVIVAPKDLTANQILTYVRGMGNSSGSNVETLYRLVDNQVEALEFIVSKSYPKLNVPLKDYKTKDNTLVAAIIRNREVIIPFGSDSLQVNDRVIVVTLNEHYHDLSDILKD